MKLLSLIFIGLLLSSCGEDEDDSSPPPTIQQPQPPQPPSSTEAIFKRDIKPILFSSCAGSSCHTSGTARDAIILTSSKFLSSSAEALIAGNKMPKPGSQQAATFPAASKQALLNFISRHSR